MIHMTKQHKVFKQYPYILTGLILIFLYYLPYFILGQDAAFRIVDFIDDEVIQYLYSGNYLFAGQDTIVKEWLSGAPLATIQPPCFTLVLFFKWFPFYTALLISCIFGTVCAFFGMFLLCDFLLKSKTKYVSLMAAFLFCILPYYPTYGISSVGIPLVTWSCFKIHDVSCKNAELTTKKLLCKCIPYFLICIFYALSSSLIWSGYFVVGFSVLGALVLLLQKKKSGIPLLLASVCMTLTYCITFRNTLINVLLETYVSHRSDPERIYGTSPFYPRFSSMFIYGQYHAPSLHTYILAFSLCVLVLGFLFFKKLNKTMQKRVLFTTGLWISLVAIAAFYGFYNTETALNLRQYLGPLQSFQLDRIYWLNPTIWYVILALATTILFHLTALILKILVAHIPLLKRIIQERTQNTLLRIFQIGLVLSLGLFLTNYIIHHENSAEYYSNVQRVFGKETGHWTYHDFYDHELFDEIEAYIGKEQSEYRIGCVAFVPAIAQANGFHTVDAYCTNYPLDYKLKFRKVIEKELEKSSTLASYYDNWGNRCYLFSSELGIRFQTAKEEEIVLKNFEIDTAALKGLGCDYLFSAVQIQNASDIHLTLLDVFTTDDSCIEIYVYQL